MTVKEFYNVVSARSCVDIDLFEGDVYVPIGGAWEAKVLFVKSWNVFQQDVRVGNTDYMRKKFILHFGLEVKR